ncbi:MAG: hypothetical protein DDG60_06390 [Anaerolineae bacterium]|nr:MAG: hypothetical protein DDG60_06390 [Anaerolineae bacterium]
MEDLTGRNFGPYQIVAPLGEGGMAAVYKAYQPSMERYVALKILPRQMAQSEEFIARFRREARLVAQLQHPHILPVFDYGESDGYTYIVMPFVQSGTLSDLLKSRRLSYAEIRRIIVQIADALGYAHAHGMIHRDVKPSNVLIDERGNCLLTDFGLARMAEATSMLTSSGAIIGTPAYMSPEQGAGSPLDSRSDIYSLGIILYEMVTGRVPYSAETPIAVVFKHIQDPLPAVRNLVPDIPDGLELVLLKALAKRPEDRFQTTEEFIHAVEEALPQTSSTVYAAHRPTDVHIPAVEQSAVKPASQPPSSAPVSSPRPASQPSLRAAPTSKSVPWGLLGAGMLMLGLLGIGVLFLGINLIRSRLATRSAATPSSPPAQSTPNEQPPVVLPTSTVPVEALEITPGKMFTDDFNDNPGEGWEWQQGTLRAQERVPTRMLLRQAPPGDFEFSSAIRFPRSEKFYLAGLVLYQDDENMLIFGHSTCRLPAPVCAGAGLYFFDINKNALSETNFFTKILGNAVYLRVQRTGDVFLAAYSVDGYEWLPLGTHQRQLANLRIGLIEAPPTGEAQFTFFASSEAAQAVVRQDIECFSAPDINSDIRGVFTTGKTIWLTGRSVDSEWLVSYLPTRPQEQCWLHFPIRNRSDLVSSLPVIAPDQPAELFPTPPPLVIPPGQKFVLIKEIVLNAQNQYVVTYETFEYTESLPGTHIHFFFDTVPFDQAGSPGRGPWKVYGGPRPFSGYRTSDRPANAAQLCALVANPNHSVIPNSGNCVPLPDVASVTARMDTDCLNTPLGERVADLRAGRTVLLKGVSQDQTWFLVQNPEQREAATCWVPLNAIVLNGDLSAVPVVNP